MAQGFSKPNIPNILADVPSGKEFDFCTAEGVYTKVRAISLEDFAQKLDGVDAISLQFHYPRGDFQAWISDTIGDSELADRMCFIPRNIPDAILRQDLLKIVQRRINELKSSK